MKTLLATINFLLLSFSAFAQCDIRPDLPADTARRILAVCEAESMQLKPRQESELFKWLGRLHYPLKVADFTSTEIGLRGTGEEGNPLMLNRNVRIATTIVLPAATNWATSNIYRDHPKLATFIRIAAIAVPTALTVNNLRYR